MSDTLLGFVDAMNGIPDNTARLVSPQDSRQAWLSLTQDRGVAVIDPAAGPPPITVPLVVDVWTDIPTALFANGGGMNEGLLPLFWRMDVNGHLGYDYAADWPTTVVPPGYLRQVIATAVIEFDLAGSNDIYEFAITEDGVPIQPFIGVEEGSSQSVLTQELTTALSVDVSLAPRISVAVRNTTASTGLDIYAFGYLCEGGPPA